MQASLSLWDFDFENLILIDLVNDAIVVERLDFLENRAFVELKFVEINDEQDKLLIIDKTLESNTLLRFDSRSKLIVTSNKTSKTSIDVFINDESLSSIK